LWDYAFARHWFKVNLTTDLAGQIVETGDQHSGLFAFNCDIAIPMRRRGGAVFAVDLFADVLVRADSITYLVCDLEELERALLTGLVLAAEARVARSGLAELTGIIEQGDLLAFLSRACPTGPLDPPPAVPLPSSLSPGNYGSGSGSPAVPVWLIAPRPRASRPGSAARHRKPAPGMGMTSCRTCSSSSAVRTAAQRAGVIEQAPGDPDGARPNFYL
jgi:hypothetical protein